MSEVKKGKKFCVEIHTSGKDNEINSKKIKEGKIFHSKCFI